METDTTNTPTESPEVIAEPQYVSIDQLAAMDIRVGTICVAEPVEGSEKLVRCLIDFGPEMATHEITAEDGSIMKLRQIVSGIHMYFTDLNELVGKQALYILNLAPRKLMGVESHGMLLAVGDNDCVLLTPHKPVEPGSKIH
jgi:methionyl-tRNA synthetase